MNFLISSREFFRQKGPLFLYVVSLVFSLGVFISLDSIQVNVTDYIDQEKQKLVGGDIEISSRQPFSEKLMAAVAELEKQYEVAETYRFSSMVSGNDQAILSQIKIVSPEYPLYGAVELASGRSFSDTLQQGTVVVQSSLLTRLDIEVGATIQLGNATLKVADIITKEPDRSLNLGGFGPRILVSTRDLDSLGLVGDKSRVSYEKFVKIPELEAQEAAVTYLKSVAEKQEEIESLAEAETTLSRFSNRFLLFLKLVIFSLLILTGIGIISILKSFLQSQSIIIATRKSLGENPRDLIFSYLKTFALWSGVGIVGAMLIAESMILLGQNILAPILPVDISLGLSLVSIIKSVCIGMGTTLLFGLYALEKTTKITPAKLFRSDETSTSKFFEKSTLWIGLIVIIYALFIFLELERILWTATFLGGILVLFFVFWGLSILFLTLIAKIEKRFNYKIKLVIRSLQRSGSATSLFLAIFTLSLTLIFSMIIMENAIQKQFIVSYPENAPNVFLLDIKREQTEEIATFFPESLDFFPVIRSSIVRVNDKTIEQIRAESSEFGDNITRPFNLTYYEQIPDNEQFTDSLDRDQLFASVDDGFVPISIIDEIARDLDAGLRDIVIFNIQGVEIATQITSIRTRLDTTTPMPFFYFVFRPEDLADAPYSLFATGRFESEDIGQLQADISRKFPQISVLDTSAITEQIGGILGQLSLIVKIFTLFNLFAGFVIFIASLMATSEERKAEAVFYRLQGMTIRDVWKVVNYEFLCIALFTINTSIAFSWIVGQSVLYYLFDLSLGSLPYSLYFYILGTFVSIFGFGFLILYKPLKTKPITFIRENVRE